MSLFMAVKSILKKWKFEIKKPTEEDFQVIWKQNKKLAYQGHKSFIC